MKMRDIYLAIGRRVRDLRTRGGLTIEELAHGARLTPSFVGQIERGERKLSVEALARLADALGVRPSDLVSEARISRRLAHADPIARLADRLSSADRSLLLSLLRLVVRRRAGR